MTKFDSLSDDPIWEMVASISQYVYAQIEHFPEEEKWGMASTMRRHAFDITNDVAEAAGSPDPRDRMHHYGRARKALFALKSVLTMAKRMKYIQIDPEQMVSIEDVIKQIDQQFDNAQRNIVPYLAQFDRQTLTEAEA